MRQVFLYREPGEDGKWIGRCLSLPDCVSEGATQEEALVNIREAIERYEEALQLHGDPIPEDRLNALLISV